MKKTVSLVLVLVMMLALGAVAYADYGILVTKHPTDETRTEGETAWFVSGAQYYNTLDWTFVGPSGREYNVKEFLSMFPYVTVEGENTTTLTVRNLSTELNGWAVFCSFHSDNDNAKTNWAFFHVNTYVPTYTQPVYTDSDAVPYGGGYAGYRYYDNEYPYDGGYAGSNYYDNEFPDGGGYAGYRYYDNEYPYDGGGYAGIHYYDY